MGRYNLTALDDLDQPLAQTSAAPQFADPKAALKDPRFLKLLRQHYRAQGELTGFASDETVIDMFYSDRNWAELNTVGAIADAVGAQSASAEERERARTIQDVYNRLPSMFSDGGRGWGAVPDVAKALIADPVNLIGGAVGKGAAAAGTRGALAAGKTASQAARAGVARGVGRAALAEGAIGGASEAAVDTALQSRDISLGLQDGFSRERLLTSTAMGAALGAGAGGLLSVPSALAGAREGAAAFAEEAAEEATLAARTAALEADLDAAQADQETHVAALKSDQVEGDQVAEAEAQLTQLSRLRALSQKFRAEAAKIDELAASDDPEDVIAAAQLRTIYERDYATFRTSLDSGDAEAVEAALRRFERRKQAKPAKPAKVAKAATAPDAPKKAPSEADAPAAPDGADVPATPAADPEAQAPAAEKVTAPPAFSSRGAAALAARLELDPEEITPGPKGKIRVADVRALADERGISTDGTEQPPLDTSTEAPAEPAPKINVAKRAQTRIDAYNAQNPDAPIDPQAIPRKNAGGKTPNTVTTGDVKAYIDQIEAGEVQPGEAPIDTPPPAKAAEEPATPEPGGSLSEEDKAKALARGVDWQAAIAANPGVSEKRAVVIAMQNKRRGLDESGQVPEDGRVAELRAAASEIIELALQDGAETIDDVLKITARLSTDADYRQLGADLPRYVDMIMAKAHERGLLFDPAEDEFPDVVLNAAQQNRAKAIARALRKEEPELDDGTVIALAKNRVVMEDRNKGARYVYDNGVWRSSGRSGTPSKSGTRGSGASAENARLYSAAGIGSNGRIQGFLRRSAAIKKGSDYGIGGDVEYPMAHNFSLDAALIHAQQTGQITPFVASGTERVKAPKTKGFTTAPKGTMLYADPKTGNAYSTLEYAKYMRGDPSAPVAASPVDESAAIAQARKARKAEKRAARERVSDVVRDDASLKAALQAKRDGKPIPETVPVEDGDKLLIIRNRQTGDVRMMSKKQAAEGKTLRDLLGKADPADWDVAYAPPPKQRNARALKAAWDAVNEEPEAAASALDAAPDAQAAGEPFTPDGPPPRLYDEARQASVDLDEDEALALTQAAQAIGLPKTFEAGEPVTYAVLSALRHRFETAPWSLTMQTRATGLARLNEMMSRAVPEGVIWDQPTRAESIRQVRQIFEPFSPEEVAEAERLISRLGGSKDVGPRLTEVRGQAPSHFRDYGSGENRVQINPRGDLGTVTRIGQLYHEVAHWAYFNILTDADRAEFWRAMEKHEAAGPEGRADFLPRPESETMEAGGQTVRVTTNAPVSPQEMFANQFEMWITRRGDTVLADEGYWARMRSYVKAIFDRFVKGAQIDPDLEPLFARILPDDAEAAKFRTNVIDRQPSTSFGTHIHKRLTGLRVARDDIEQAIASGSPEGIVNAHQELVRTVLLSIAPWSRGKKPNLAAGEIDGKTFSPTRKLVAVIHNRVKDYNEIIARTGQGGKFDDPAKELDTIIDGDALVDAADLLTDFYEKGYTGRFQPENGVPARIKKLEDTSTVALLDMLYNALELTYRKAEGGHLPPGTKPASAKARVAQEARPEGAPAPKARAAARKKVARQKARADAVAEDWTKQAREARAFVREAGDADLDEGLRAMSIQKLRNRVRFDDGTPNLAIAYELKTRLQARSLPARKVAVKPAIRALATRDLENAFYQAAFDNDREAISQTSYELTRRAQKKRGRAQERALLRPQKEEMREAITREIADHEGAPEQLGIPPNARPAIRELLSFLTHRDPEVTATMRTMAYRMLNLLGKASRRAIDDTNILTAADVARMAGHDPADAGPAVFADFRDPAFGQLRNDLRRLSVGLTKGKTDPLDIAHEIGHMLVRSGVLPDGEARAIREAFRTATGPVKERVERLYTGKYAHRPDDEREALLADEWFAEEFAKYLAERVTRGDVYDQINTGALTDVTFRSRFDSAIDRMGEYLAYVFNGLLGRKDVRQTFRRLMFYGDMTAAPARAPLADGGKRASLPPGLAPAYAQDVLKSSPKERTERIMAFVGSGYGARDGKPVTFYHGTPNGAALRRETNPDVVVRASGSGDFGPGFYVTADARPASQFYARQPTRRAMLAKIQELHPDMTEEQVWEVEDFIDELHVVRAEILRARREIAAKMTDVEQSDEVTAFLAEEELAGLYETVADLAAEESELAGELARATGFDVDPYVAPVYIRLNSPADFRRFSPAADNTGFIEGLGAELVRRGHLSDTSLGQLIGAAENMDMNDVYQALVQVMSGEGGYLESQARLTAALKDLGYDGLLTRHVNTLNVEGSSEIGDSGATFAGQPVTHDVPVLFDPNQVKHVQASDFDAADPRLYKRERESLPRDVNATLIEGIMEERIESTRDVLPSSVAETADTKAAKGLSGALMSIMRQRDLTAREKTTLMNYSPVGWFKTQAGQMRHMGMNWLADFYEPSFPAVSEQFAKRFMPLHRALSKLPDADGKMRGWARRATGGLGQKQPKSHAKILRALRRPSGNAIEKDLTPLERRAYDMIRTAMRTERKTLVDLGIFMGNRGDDYMPQVWDKAKIEKRAPEFRAAMGRYFEIEAEKAGKPREDGDAAAFANRMYERLVGDDGDGVFVPQAAAGSRNPNADNIDYARMIELDKHPEALEALEPFLENDIEAVLVKYFEGTSRRAVFTDKLGVNSHAAYDYMQVVDLGPRGIARLLSTDKVFKKDVSVLDWNAMPDHASIETLVPMPFSGNEAKAASFAKELVAAHAKGGAAAARKMLDDIAPRTASGRVSPAYVRRADAITGALDDFGGKPSELRNPEFHRIEDSLRVAMRKRRQNTNERAARASGLARSFNSVTLLGFTTLTSLGDVALPIIRSGEMKSYVKALKTFASDPEYRELIAGTGVAIENIVQDRMLHMFGATDTKLTSAFFNATLLTPWTDMNRQVAGAVGYETAKAMQKKAVRLYKEGVPPHKQPAGYRTAHRFLASVGLEEFLPGGLRAGESLAERGLLERDEVVRQAIIRFADKAIFTPNPNDIPLWAQTPVGALIFQLKSFPLMMTRLGGHVLSEAKQGNVKPLAYFLTLGPAFGMGALAAKDVIQMRGGDDGKSPELRQRNLLKTLGYDKEVHGDEDDFLGWYMEGLMTMGGLGLIGDVTFGIASQVENGAYGQTRVVSLLGGPTMGTGLAALTVLGGVADRNEGSNAKERSAAREVATRVPIVGGNRRAREALVDAVAGSEDDNKSWTSKSWSNWK